MVGGNAVHLSCAFCDFRTSQRFKRRNSLGSFNYLQPYPAKRELLSNPTLMKQQISAILRVATREISPYR